MDSLTCMIFFSLSVLWPLVLTVSAQNTRCVQTGTVEVNNTHPSANTNWTDTEQYTNLTTFCIGGTVGIKCIDEKGEFMEISQPLRNTTVYIATCEPIKGLWCRPYGSEHCPDFSAIYTCTCPITSASTTITVPSVGSSAYNTKAPIGSSTDNASNSKTPTTTAAAITSTPRQARHPSTKHHVGNSGVTYGYVFQLSVTLIMISFFL